MDEAGQLVLENLKLDPSYKVLFLQGGASTQFAMVPMNLLNSGDVAGYINTGTWAKKAIKEAKLFLAKQKCWQAVTGLISVIYPKVLPYLKTCDICT